MAASSGIVMYDDCVTPAETSKPRESAIAHIARGGGSSVCLCGYQGVRRATLEEALRAGICVVCFEMYYGHLPTRDGRARVDMSDENVAALLELLDEHAC